MPDSIFSNYRTGENRLTAILAVLPSFVSHSAVGRVAAEEVLALRSAPSSSG